MPYLIDGHNLIPKIPGLALSDVDDEDRLVEILQEFCRRQRKQVEVYFDNAQPGSPRGHNFGLVTARYVRQETTADNAIRGRLTRLGREARNWIVVSSDLAVQSSARAVQAHFVSSEAFASLLLQTLAKADKDQGENSEISLKPDELDEWMDLFGKPKDEG
jgi:uncharacterized protein